MASNQILLYGESHTEAVFQAAELRERRLNPTSIGIHRALRQKDRVRTGAIDGKAASQNDRSENPLISIARRSAAIDRMLERFGSRGTGQTLGDTSLDRFIQLSRRLTASDVIVSMIGGNQYAVLSTIQHPVPFDVLEPGAGEETLRPGTRLIAYRIISSIIDDGIRARDGRTLRKIRDATTAKMVHLIPPPPKKDSEFIRNYHEKRFSEDIAKLGVSPPELRMKIWRMQRDLLHGLCEELGIEALDPPGGSLDEDGFLKPACYAKDVTHANRHYGLLLLEELESRFACGNGSAT